MYTPGINRWPRVVPAGLSTQHNLAAAKPALRDGGSLWLLSIVSWLVGRGEGKHEAYGEVGVNCPFHPGLIWKWVSNLFFLILFPFFFLGGCNVGEQEPSVGVSWWGTETGAGRADGGHINLKS